MGLLLGGGGGRGGLKVTDYRKLFGINFSVELIPSYLPKVKSKDHYSTHPHNLILLE